MKLKQQVSTILFWATSIFILLLVVSCQGQVEPTPDSVGLLDDMPSISEALGTTVPTPPPLPTADPDMLAIGMSIYDQYCAACHGANLEGAADWKTQNADGSFRPPPHNAEGHTWHHNDRILIEAIKEGGARLPDNIGGTSNMPAFKDVLTNEEITAVLAYIKSSWPEDIRQAQWEQTATDPNKQ